MHGLQGLQWILAIQIGVIALRHWRDFDVHLMEASTHATRPASPDLSQASIFVPIYLLLFLSISRSLIHIFAAAERERANQLQQQMTILSQTKADLEESEMRYRNFFNLPLVGTAITDTDRRWVAVNDKTGAILGYSREELFRRTWTDLTHPDDLPTEMALFKRMLRNDIHGYQIEKRFIRKDGSIVHTLMAGGQGPRGGHQSGLFHMNIIDISDRKLVEAKLLDAQQREHALAEQQRSQLEQKLKTSLTASAVVHEIQQPLATILLNCRLAEATISKLPEASIPAMLRTQLSQLTANGDQVTATMERVRMLLRNVETQPAPLDLCINIESSLIYLRQDLQQKQIQLISHGLQQPCPLMGDGSQLQSAVVNLIRNAIQAMDEQPPDTRHLLIHLQDRHDLVSIHVADSGPGFPLDYSGTTSWELLKSTKASGMGIGLFLAQTAAINHGGCLRIGRHPRLGGAEVVIEIPRRLSAPPEWNERFPSDGQRRARADQIS
jgi:PAS domain S-box-containing protein